jgi:rhomboid family GlyGly-CTERM serine protease
MSSELNEKKPAGSLSTFLPQGSREVWAAPLALMALMLVAETLGDAGREWLAYQRAAVEAGQWWRFLTGNLVHLGWYHWFLNTLGVLVLVLLCPERLSPAVWARRVILIGIGMTLCLYLFVPELPAYVGMSGVIHGLFVLGLMPQVLKKDLIALGCLLYLLGKVGYELYAGAPVSDAEAIGGEVVVESHMFGAICALLYGFAFNTFRSTETWSRR